jgi:hypothetical protein
MLYRANEALIKEVQWVRLVQNEERIVGIGFKGNQLVHFLATQAVRGLMGPISIEDSMHLLRLLAGFELARHPDVESNPLAWRRWLRLLV